MRRRFFNLNVDYSKEYFTIEALEDGLTVKLSQNISEYRIDNGTWTSLRRDMSTQSVNSGQKIQFRISSISITINNGIGTFTISKKCKVYGNIMSLLYGDNFEKQVDLTNKNYVFSKLFYNCNTIVDASKLILPATTLAIDCYNSMFYSCTSLTSAPELPATTLARCCYGNMFKGCISLTSAPELPATTLYLECYLYMFLDCTGLTSAPELPATTLADYCYYNMFYGCTSLTIAPSVLPATTLARHCYYRMFYGCTSLVEAPKLPSTTLIYNCYYSMFKGCSKLNKITMLATNISATFCLSNWVDGVASSGTFVKNKDATWNVVGVSGVPEGWTVITE